MRKLLPVFYLGLTFGCGIGVAWLSQSNYELLRAVVPMVITSQGLAHLYAVLHVGGLVILSFLAGVFSMLIFVCGERKTDNG